MLFVFLFFQTFELSKIDIQGLSRFAPEAIFVTTGLKSGVKAGKPEFVAACEKLVRSGMFRGCDWKYQPTSPTGATLTLELVEAEAPQKVRLKIPGADEKALWDWMKVNEPLVTPQMPGSDEAVQFYTNAIKRYLKQDVVSNIDTDLATKENTFSFRPANAPTIDSVKFTGAQAIDAAALEKKLNPIAKGTAYSEHDVMQLLNMNIRPMYENLGRLNVSFPSIEAQGGVVTVSVDEGRVFKIGKVEGVKLASGEVADWGKVTAALEEGAQALRNQGYLNARYKVDRKLNDDGTVDIAASYTKGEQFTFGALKLSGLNPTQEAAVRSVWVLKPGAPMSDEAVSNFVKASFGKLGPEFSGVGQQLEPREGSTVVDVVITFRRK